MGYFEFLPCSRIICLALTTSLQKPRGGKVSILTHPEEQHLPFKQTGTTTNFSFEFQSCTWPLSGPFCWQNPFLIVTVVWFVIGLVLILEYTFFQVCFNNGQISSRRSYVNPPAVVLIKVTQLFCLVCAVQSCHVPFLAAVCRNDSAFA